MLQLFDYEMCDTENEDVYRIHTGNWMDSIYAVKPEGMSLKDFEYEVGFSLRRKLGKRARVVDIIKAH